MNNYWQMRSARQMHNQMQTAEEYARDLAEYYIRASRQLAMDSQNIIGRFQLRHNLTKAEAERILSRMKNPADMKELIKELRKDPKNADLIREFEAQASRARLMRLDSLHDQVTYVCGQIQTKLTKKAQKLFVKLAKQAYYRAMFDMQQYAGYGYKVKTLDEKLIKSVMDKSWAGSGFSQRIWQNTQDLEKAVKRELMTNLLTGRPLFQSSKAIDEEFNKGFNNARRLMRTESAYITNQMKLEAYKAQGVEKYVYVAILDLKTSKVCRSLDKKRFLVKNAEIGVNFPPMHPWCRSTTVPWVSDTLLKNMKQRALDPATGKRVIVRGDMTYDEWYRQFVQGKPVAPSGARNLTREQYDRYKARLGDNFPYTYDEFIKLKTTSEWAKWQKIYKEAK